MNQRLSIAALAVAGLLALAACGDPDDPPQGAQSETAAAEAQQRLIDAHTRFQAAAEAQQRLIDAHSRFQDAITDAKDHPGYNSHLVDLEALNRDAITDAKVAEWKRWAARTEKDHQRYVPVSPDQIERRAVAQAKSPTLWWADPARHPANQDAPSSSALPWWAQKR
jgi:hypothetical protein